MMKLLRLLSMVFLIITLIGCGLENKEASTNNEGEEVVIEKDEKTDKEIDKDIVQEDTSAADGLIKAAKKAETVDPEIEFVQTSWMMGAPKRQQTGGVWLYSGVNHPAEITNSYKWEEKDVLLVQISNKEFMGYDIEVRALQVVSDEVINIKVELIEPDNDKTDAPRKYMAVAKGALDDKLFVVSSLNGDILETE